MARILGYLWWVITFGRRRAWMARRDHRGVAFLGFTAVAALGDVIAGYWSLSLLLFFVLTGEWALVAITACAIACLMMRRVVIEHVTIPLGLYRTTYMLAEIDRWFMNEPLGVARLSAARAMMRAGVPESAEAWWKSVQPGQLGAYDIAASAVLARGRGDRRDAVTLLESIVLLREPAPQARELAAEWLAAEDADDGRWEAILERASAKARPGRGAHRKPEAIEAEHGVKTTTGGEMLWPPTSTTYFFEGVAGRMLGRADAPSQVGMWIRWLETRHRRMFYPLLKRALAGGSSPAKPKAEPTTTTTTTTSNVLADAVRVHIDVVARPTESGLAAAAEAWDAALKDQEWRTQIAMRAIELGAPTDAASRAVEEMRVQVVSDVASAILSGGVSLPSLLEKSESDVLAAAAARARAELLARLEVTFERIGGRVTEHVAIAPIDEWRSFLAIRAAYGEAARQGGAELERLAFPHAHSELTSWSVWMWNDRKEHAISHGMTTWLFERALAVGDAQAIELHGKNALLEPSAE